MTTTHLNSLVGYSLELTPLDTRLLRSFSILLCLLTITIILMSHVTHRTYCTWRPPSFVGQFSQSPSCTLLSSVCSPHSLTSYISIPSYIRIRLHRTPHTSSVPVSSSFCHIYSRSPNAPARSHPSHQHRIATQPYILSVLALLPHHLTRHLGTSMSRRAGATTVTS